MRIENFPKQKRCDHSPKQDEFIDVSLDPPYFSLDSPFKLWLSIFVWNYAIMHFLCYYSTGRAPGKSAIPSGNSRCIGCQDNGFESGNSLGSITLSHHIHCAILSW